MHWPFILWWTYVSQLVVYQGEGDVPDSPHNRRDFTIVNFCCSKLTYIQVRTTWAEGLLFLKGKIDLKYKCFHISVEPVSCNSPLMRLHLGITAIQQLELRRSVCWHRRRGDGLRDSVPFYKAISNSLQRLPDNPDTVHLLQQQGFLVSFQFSPFFLCVRRSAGLNGGSSHCSGVLGEERTGHCLWHRTKTFRIAITQPSLNMQFHWIHRKWTIIMLESAAWEMAGRPEPGLRHWNAS